jgi:hypothetical protein
MKETYITPSAEVIRFETEDVITTSGVSDLSANDLDYIEAD